MQLVNKGEDPVDTPPAIVTQRPLELFKGNESTLHIFMTDDPTYDGV